MIAEALNRTTLLMRTDLVDGAAEERLVAALTGVVVAIAADAAVVATAAGRTAVITSSLLMARSGHAVWVSCPDAAMAEPQPPCLTGVSLHEALRQVGEDLLPGCAIRMGLPEGVADLAVVYGDATAPLAGQIIFLGASDWAATLSSEGAQPWPATVWPIGAMAAAAMAAAEAFKVAMRRVADLARSEAAFSRLFAPAASAQISLAPPETPHIVELGAFDLVSGGAIANAVLFALYRLPGVAGSVNVLDDDVSALSNLNRNALLLRSAVGQDKVEDLARYGLGLRITPAPVRFAPGVPVGDVVLVGVDDIPSRWAVQATRPAWLGVGATAAYSVQVSAHEPGGPCVGCLHPSAGDATGPIPTVAFVSFWSGLLLAVRLILHRAGHGASADAQTYFSPLRPEGWIYAGMGVPARPDCPVACEASGRA